MSKEQEFSRERSNSPTETLKANVEAQIFSAFEEHAMKQEQVGIELAEVPPEEGPEYWEVFALGPFQTPSMGQSPGRIIALGEKAYLVTIVFLNKSMNANVSRFAGKIQLNYYTSNTQTMLPVSPQRGDLESCCFPPVVDPNDPDVVITPVVTPYGSFYVIVDEFTPSEAACILETNICARLCNCDDKVVPGYAAFVRWIGSLDFDAFFPPVPFTYDHPIRYLVYDSDAEAKCECTKNCGGELP